MPGAIATIQAEVEISFGLSHDELLSYRRAKPLVQARIMAMALARELTQASLPLIGREFADRDHTTVLNAVRRDRELVHRDADYAAMRLAVLAKLVS